MLCCGCILLLYRAERPAVNTSEIQDSPRTCPVNPSVWGAVLRFAGCPVCVFLPVPEAHGRLRVLGRENPLFAWLSLESPVACSLENGYMIIKIISLPHPRPRPGIPRTRKTKTTKIKPLDPVCPGNREQRTWTFPHSGFQTLTMSQIKEDRSHETARQVPRELQTHGEVVVKVPAGRAGLLGGRFPLCRTEPIRRRGCGGIADTLVGKLKVHAQVLGKPVCAIYPCQRHRAPLCFKERKSVSLVSST